MSDIDADKAVVRAFWDDLYSTGDLRPVIQLSGSPQKELKGIPHIDNYAKTDEDRQVIDLMFAGHVDRGTTLVLVTHDNTLAQRCDRIVRLRSGRIEHAHAAVPA